jgi:hypothetical protein
MITDSVTTLLSLEKEEEEKEPNEICTCLNSIILNFKFMCYFMLKFVTSNFSIVTALTFLT